METSVKLKVLEIAAHLAVAQMNNQEADDRSGKFTMAVGPAINLKNSVRAVLQVLNDPETWRG